MAGQRLTGGGGDGIVSEAIGGEWMKKHWRVGIGLAALLALGAGCFRNTISEMELDVPAMKTEACAKIVADAVAGLGVGEGGVIEGIRFDLPERKAWVRFDNVRLGRRNIEVAIRHAGFAVNDLPANPEARAKLPAECRGDE
jgi:copper chaperone CopZ